MVVISDSIFYPVRGEESKRVLCPSAAMYSKPQFLAELCDRCQIGSQSVTKDMHRSTAAPQHRRHLSSKSAKGNPELHIICAVMSVA